MSLQPYLKHCSRVDDGLHFLGHLRFPRLVPNGARCLQVDGAGFGWWRMIPAFSHIRVDDVDARVALETEFLAENLRFLSEEVAVENQEGGFSTALLPCLHECDVVLRRGDGLLGELCVQDRFDVIATTSVSIAILTHCRTAAAV